jgi:hypothetical protein
MDGNHEIRWVHVDWGGRYCYPQQGADSPRATPLSERAAAATLARDCTDHAAVIRWCADRVRSCDDDPAVQDAADYLDDLATRAEPDTTEVRDRAAVIRWCAGEVHSMGGGYAVERAAEYLDGLATEAESAVPAAVSGPGSSR